MEQEFYRDEFEQLLKDTTDDFKMYPSRKVWYSIYNDLHPDRKWPSFAVCLLLLSGILYVGVSNNNSINNSSRTNKLNYSTVATTNNTKNNKEIENVSASENNTKKNYRVGSATVNRQRDNNIYFATARELQTQSELNTQTGSTIAQKSKIQKASSIIISQKEATTAKITVAEATYTNESVAVVNEEEDDLKEIAAIENNESKAAKPAATFNTMQQSKSTENREWVDDFAFHNKKKEGSPFKGGWSTQFYVAPSIGYRVLFRNKKYTTANENALIAANSRTSIKGAEPNEQGALNIEAGAGIIKEITPKLRIKTGLQFNYTDFITNAQRLDYPTATTVAINNYYGVTMEGYSSLYANTPGKNKDQLHNRTLQLSIPLGVDYKLFDNKRIAWYAGASFQPTYVSGGYAWAESADNNFYVEDENLLRRWNFNAGFESFVSFKTPSGASINLGPQFRYQLMSTYTKRYTYTEKPYNIGFKIGLSKPL